MNHPFGDLISQHLHRKHGLSQAKLAEGILQNPSIIGKMCKGQRLTGPQARERVTAIIGWLRQQGVLTTLEEANALLQAAGMAPLQERAPAEVSLIRKLSTPASAQQRPAADTAPTPVRSPQTMPRHNLPAQLTPFIGRAEQIAQLAQHLQNHRLLTLTGAGGVGKTRLALEVATRVLAHFADGVWFVDLTPLTDSAAIPQRILDLWRVPEQSERSPLETLIAYLSAKQTLLILDNCEHLIDACAALAETLLQHCPQLSLLATSREALNIGGETPWRVPSLTRPRTGSDWAGPSTTMPPAFTPEALARFEAVALFVERARVRQPDFALTPANAGAVAHICTRLDGIPLALEMAAARVNIFTVEEIARRLDGAFDGRFHLLTNGARTAPLRHQTLRAMLEWSYGLLPAQEQCLLVCLSVFSGGWTFAAAQEVTGCSLDQLAQLVNKSLVIADQQGGQTRYRLLETVRQFAYAQLAQASETETMHRTHARYFFELAKQTAMGFSGNEWSTESRYPLKQEMDNLRVAYRWIVTHEPATLEMQFLIQVYGLGGPGGHIDEVDRWFEAALPRIKPELTIEYAYFLFVLASGIAYRQGNLKKALAYAEESLALHRQLEHPFRGVVILELMAHIHYDLGNYVTARSFIEECMLIAREASPSGTLADVLRLLWDILIDLNDEATAQEVLHEMLSLYPSLEGPGWQAQARHILAEEAFLQGDLSLARARCEEALQLFQRFNDTGSIAGTLLLLCRITYRQGDQARASIVLDELLSLARALGAQTLLYTVLLIAGLVAQENGELLQAQALLTECLVLAQENAFLYAKGRQQAKAAYLLGGLAGLLKQPEQAARLLGVASQLLSTAYHFPRLVVEQAHYERIFVTVRAQLDDATFTRTWNAGQEMTLDEAFTYVVEILQFC